ncbi:pyridoxal-phosphate dependent enzyme [Pseudonocardiaceae bacterium YIM PH 21723]|nr:pyridoxal-phosphate dependent enzyme [Pseudonocardiaceae bacterium YIM PH 21723]
MTAGTIAAQAERIAPALGEYLTRTPLTEFAAFSEELGAQVLVKCEHLQRTGSFKARGSLAKLLSLSDEVRGRGVSTASSGNHGLGVANACSLLGTKATVFVHEDVAPVKAAAIRRLGADLRIERTPLVELEGVARRYAAEYGLTYVSPYNDLDVIAGQGTIGVEIADQVDRLDTVFISVGGGGLISGVASVLKARMPGIRVIGVQPAVDAAMYESARAGHSVLIDGLPTLSDGTSGNVEESAVTIGLCASLVDEWVLVPEREIAAALRTIIDTEHQLVEGSAAMAFAAARMLREQIAGQRVGVLSCGANISAKTLVRALADV